LPGLACSADQLQATAVAADPLDLTLPNGVILLDDGTAALATKLLGTACASGILLVAHRGGHPTSVPG
jgi:hypothetical protein